MDRQRAGDEIGFARHDIAVFANACDVAGTLQFAQSIAHGDAFAPFEPELARNLNFVERSIIALAQQCENLLSNLRSVLGHGSETILLDPIVDLTKLNRRQEMKKIIGGLTITTLATAALAAGGVKMKISS